MQVACDRRINAARRTDRQETLGGHRLPQFERQVVAGGVHHHLTSLRKLAIEHPCRQRVEHQPLQRALERSRAVGRVETLLGQQADRVLQAIGAVTVPDGQPFPSADDLIRYAFEG